MNTGELKRHSPCLHKSRNLMGRVIIKKRIDPHGLMNCDMEDSEEVPVGEGRFI